MTRLDELTASAQEALQAAFSARRPVFLAYSGGRDSTALLELCRPYRGRFSLLWADTGFAFPHVEAFIRAQGETFGLVERRSDLRARWEAFGLPTEILPISHAIGRHSDKPLLQPWLTCCDALRMQPLVEFMFSQPAPITILHGQRHTDAVDLDRISAVPGTSGSAMIAPLADWTDADVATFIAEHGIPLPGQYADGLTDSLDCWCCPAALANDKSARRIAYMQRHYPTELETVAELGEIVHAAGRSALDSLRRNLDHATRERNAA